MVDMKDTVEHHLDTFGLQTLEMRSGMFLYALENISQFCWILDKGRCVWVTVYDQHTHPMLVLAIPAVLGTPEWLERENTSFVIDSLQYHTHQFVGRRVDMVSTVYPPGHWED